jgi:hypothetical protein
MPRSIPELANRVAVLKQLERSAMFAAIRVRH